MRCSLRLRLALVGTVTIGFAIALATVGMELLFFSHIERRTVTGLGRQLDQVMAGLAQDAQGTLYIERPPADPRFTTPYGGLYWQIEASGQLLTSRSLWDYTLVLAEDTLPPGRLHVHDLIGPQGEQLLAVERRVTIAHRSGPFNVRAAAAVDRRVLKGAREDFRSNLLPYSAMLAVTLIIAGWLQIVIGLKPLDRILKRLAQVRGGQAQRLGRDFPGEVLPLVSEVDALLIRREADVEKARTRASDLAHGFKTPLQALMGEADRLRGKDMGDSAHAIEQIVGVMRQHIDRELARAHVSLRARHSAAPVDETVRGLVSVLSRTGAGQRITFRQEVPGELAVSAARGDLTEALGALMENAARHARSTVAISASARDGHVVIVLRDDGPGIPPDQIQALLQRGARADARGSGLGLGIAREIVDALGGQMTFGSADPGLEVRLTLPAARLAPR